MIDSLTNWQVVLRSFLVPFIVGVLYIVLLWTKPIPTQESMRNLSKRRFILVFFLVMMIIIIYSKDRTK